MGPVDGVDGRHVVLVGSMGVGKSTVGRLVAELLERDFADLDTEVEVAAGMGIADMTAAGDASAWNDFRALEADTLATLLDAAPPKVIATGGGAVLDPASRQRLAADPVVVWLRADVAVVVDRLDPAEVAQRPLLGGDVAATLQQLMEERAPLYAEVADLTVDAAGEPAEVAVAVVAGVGS